VLRPSGFRWERWEGRYISDPYTYLQYARDGHGFFSAHRREPIFPFATRLFLRLLSNQDIAVSFAAMCFSILAIAGTFLLGYYAFSYWVGLGAAAAVAIEYDMVTQGIVGWRDDAFTCAVVFSALAFLRYDRVASIRNAVIVGVTAGLACLVRITATSFLIPTLGWIVITQRTPWSERLRNAAVTVAVAAVIAGPYLFNCWRTFGDPLYAINVHADVYRAAEGQSVAGRSQTAFDYISERFRVRPWQTVDTAILGLTVYPFTNKWDGFRAWHPAVGRLLSWASLVGLFLFIGSREGRLLLVVLASSLVPYMLTWTLIHDWRFTEHAYPFFLIAAFFAIVRAASLAKPSSFKRLAALRAGNWRSSAVAGWTAASIGVIAVTWIVLRVLPVAIVTEELRRQESVSITAGERDAAFFKGGWSPPAADGAVTVRVTSGPRPTIWLPLADQRDYRLTIRMDPFPRPSPGADVHQLPRVRVYLNGVLLQSVDLVWNPERVGAYDVVVPNDIVSASGNYLELRPVPKAQTTPQVRVWYVRIHPGQI
jgi:hypothetical protein